MFGLVFVMLVCWLLAVVGATLGGLGLVLGAAYLGVRTLVSGWKESAPFAALSGVAAMAAGVFLVSPVFYVLHGLTADLGNVLTFPYGAGRTPPSWIAQPDVAVISCYCLAGAIVAFLFLQLYDWVERKANEEAAQLAALEQQHSTEGPSA